MNPGVTVIPSASTIGVSSRGEVPHVVVRADGDEAAVLHGESLGPRKGVVHREDAPVDENRGRAGRRPSSGRTGLGAERASPAPAAAAPVRRRNSDRLYLVHTHFSRGVLIPRANSRLRRNISSAGRRETARSKAAMAGLDFVSLKEKGAELVPGVGVLRIESDRAAESGNGAGRVPELSRGGREPDLGRRGRREREALFESRGGALEIPGSEERLAVLEVEDRVAVVDHGGCLVLADRIGEIPRETVAAREVEVDLEGQDVLRRELFEEGLRRSKVAALEASDGVPELAAEVRELRDLVLGVRARPLARRGPDVAEAREPLEIAGTEGRCGRRFPLADLLELRVQPPGDVLSLPRQVSRFPGVGIEVVELASSGRR